MAVRWVTGFLDSPSREAEGFWSAVTGSGLSARRGPGGEFATLVPGGGDAYLRVQVVRDGPARCHLDLHVDDVPGAASEAVARGASVRHVEGGLVVLGSPAGLAFCLVAWHGEVARPGVGRHGSRVDRVRVEVPAGVLSAEADFWEAVTGWARRSGPAVLPLPVSPPQPAPPVSSPDPVSLADPAVPLGSSLPVGPSLPLEPPLSPGPALFVGPAALPLRVLVQRAGNDRPGDERASMYLDVAAADRDAEVDRHVALGAAVVRVTPVWTVLRDPVGREYRVTDAD